MLAVISGVLGQAGAYLSDHLLKEGYTVIGFHRRSSTLNTWRVKNLLDNPSFILQEGDICDPLYLSTLLTKNKVDKFFNCAAQSHVHTSFYQPSITGDINYGGVLNILNTIKEYSPHTKLAQFSTSEMFGSEYDVDGKYEFYQDEDTRMTPNSPYAVSKLAAHHLCRVYRESYGIKVSCGIPFNYESKLRGENFVTRKITKWIGSFLRWMSNLGVTQKELIDCGEYLCLPVDHTIRFPKLRLGNIEACRDWSHCSDIVRGVAMMLDHEPDDFVFCSGETHTVKEFLQEAFLLVGLNYEEFIVIDPIFYRPCEVPFLRGVSTKAKKELGWTTQVSFKELVKEMVEADK